MRQFKSILENTLYLYLYSNLHIAICVGLFTVQTFILFDGVFDLNYTFFLSLATSLLYAMHRLIGIDLAGKYKYEGRFGFIYKMRYILFIMAVATAAATGVIFINLSKAVQINLIFPVIASGLYVLPVFSGKRLRDFPLIKIFIVCIVYAYVCVFIPGILTSQTFYHILILFFARFFFIFGITIPFDIRDVKIDGATQVKTLVSILGVGLSKKISIALLCLALFLSYIHIATIGISISHFYSEILVHLLCMLLVYYASATRNDVYYAFLLDGTMGLFFVFGLFLN